MKQESPLSSKLENRQFLEGKNESLSFPPARKHNFGVTSYISAAAAVFP